MSIIDEFHESFNIPKIEYKQPGRTVDDDGDICEWYTWEDYPSIQPVFMELLNYYYGNLHGTKIFMSCEITPQNLCCTLVEAIIGNIEDSIKRGINMEDEIQDIRDIFTDYYGGEICQ